jgi:carboxypeptidase C (cathepsin A)
MAMMVVKMNCLLFLWLRCFGIAAAAVLLGCGSGVAGDDAAAAAAAAAAKEKQGAADENIRNDNDIDNNVNLDLDDCCKACDRVHHLPGFNQPLPSPWYSGYLTYTFQNRTIHTHYMLVEAEDDFNNNKPLIYWSNGGPGASSMFGLLTELGPLWLNDESLKTDDYRTNGGIPTPLYNPYSWTRLGHVLIFDQPAPVGFSYCNNVTHGPFHDCDGLAWTDELTAGNAYAAVQAFFTKFPEKKKVDFYLTGER